MNLPEVIYTGSVKNIRKADKPEHLLFEYSDRYSIFDWGEMPNHLEQKGRALTIMAHSYFQKLQNPKSWKDVSVPDDLKGSLALKDLKHSGAPHHSLGPVDGSFKSLEITKAENLLLVKKVNVFRPTFSDGQYNYSVYQEKPVDCLVPLEVIFRFGVPKGSSLLKRVKNNPEYLNELGLTQEPVEGERFTRPVIEFSTKLESEDRYLGSKKAQEISGMNDDEFNYLQNLSFLLAVKLKEIFSEQKIELWDGKFEFSFIAGSEYRKFQLVDSIGPDELRLTYKEVQLSKEVIRQFYRGSDWELAVGKAKELAKNEQTQAWKEICQNRLGQKPKPLDLKYIELVRNIYWCLANSAASENIFQAPSLDELIVEVKKALA